MISMKTHCLRFGAWPSSEKKYAICNFEFLRDAYITARGYFAGKERDPNWLIYQ